MATSKEKLDLAAAMAEAASQLIHDFANGDENTEVPTGSGPIPTLAKLAKDIGETASVVVEQEVSAVASVEPEPDKIPRAGADGKIDQEWVPFEPVVTKRLANYSALRNYTGSAKAITITQSGMAGDFFPLESGVDDGGLVIVDGNGQAWGRVFYGDVHAAWYYGNGGGFTNWGDAIQAAIAALPSSLLSGAGGKVRLPVGRLGITKPIRSTFGVCIEGEGTDIYQSRIEVLEGFVGTHAVILTGGGAPSFTNGHLKNFSINCNNAPNVGGVLFAGAYHNCSIQDGYIYGVNGNAMGIEMRPMNSSESSSPQTVCESILLKDLYVLHYDVPLAVAKPTISMTKCQEATLINVKAFSGRNNTGSVATNQASIYLEDCRGITILGGAVVGSARGIEIRSNERTISGFCIQGITYENITEDAIFVRGTSGHLITGLDAGVPRLEAPNPTNMLNAEYLQNSEVHLGVRSAVLGLGINNVCVKDFGVGSITADASARYVRLTTPNANNANYLISAATLEILKANTPGLRLSTAGRTGYWEFSWSASSTVDNGGRIVHSSGRAPVRFTDNGAASLLAFFGANPVTQRAAKANTSGATLAALETELNAIKQYLRDLGLMAS